MKSTIVILGLAGIGLAYLYFSSKNGRPKIDNPYEKPTSGKIIFNDTTQTEVNVPDSLPQPPDINIILPK